MKQPLILACRGADDLAKRVSTITDFCLIKSKQVTFKNGEVKSTLLESVRGDDVYVFQDVANTEERSVNDNLMELFVTLDAVKQASARRIACVIPTFPYARQHKKTGREGLAAAWVTREIERLGVRRIITLDIHSREIQNALDNAVMENLHATLQLVKALLPLVNFDKLVIVAPDSGAVERAKFFSDSLGSKLAMIYKERDYSKMTTSALDTNITTTKVLGNVEDSDCLLVDDMIDSGGTILRAAEYLRRNGAKRVFIATSLPFFSDPAINDFNEAFNTGVFTRVIGTDAVYKPELWKQQWFVRASIDKLLGAVLTRLHEDAPLSELLDCRGAIHQLIS
jgi:ribose-phosphate pyrophosphokinase